MAGKKSGIAEHDSVPEASCPSKDVWLVGHELCSYGEVWNGPREWDFSHLMPRIQQELRDWPDCQAYLFGCTEPQQLGLPAEDGTSRVVPIPVMVLIIAQCPPPSLLGITSVQRSSEAIVPMRRMKMSWCPWVPTRRARVGKGAAAASGAVAIDTTGRIFVLHCTQRAAGAKFTPEERLKSFEYALPYVLRPRV